MGACCRGMGIEQRLNEGVNGEEPKRGGDEAEDLSLAGA
jgi:hypothetical protein